MADSNALIVTIDVEHLDRVKELMKTLIAERDELAAKLAVYADPANWHNATIDQSTTDVQVWFGPGEHGWDIALSADFVHFDPVRDIAAFHEKFGLEYTGKPRSLTGELLRFRAKFLGEELEEYEQDADEAEDRLTGSWPYKDNAEKVPELLAKQLDALVDLVYVALGTSYLQGFNFKEAWRRVHEANMKKVRAEHASDSKRGSKLDVIKPFGWQAPDHSDLVADHAHKE